MIAHRIMLAVVCILALYVSRVRREHMSIAVMLCALCILDVMRTLIDARMWIEVAMYVAWPFALITVGGAYLQKERGVLHWRDLIIAFTIAAVMSIGCGLNAVDKSRSDRLWFYILLHTGAGLFLSSILLRRWIDKRRPSVTDTTALIIGIGELGWTIPLYLLAGHRIDEPTWTFITGLQSLTIYTLLMGLHLWILLPPRLRRSRPLPASAEPSPA